MYVQTPNISKLRKMVAYVGEYFSILLEYRQLQHQLLCNNFEKNFICRQPPFSLLYILFTYAGIKQIQYSQLWLHNQGNMDNNSLPLISKSRGKVLIAGGYGVLQQKNYGLSLALNSSFYCVLLNQSQSDPQQHSNSTDITVESHQIGQSWNYVCRQHAINKQKGASSQQSQESYNQILVQKQAKINPFLYNAILWTLIYFKTLKTAGKIKLQILFNKNFISDHYILENSDWVFPEYAPGYSKTGLGSSACVLVSVVKCLAQFFINQNIRKSQEQKSPAKQNTYYNWNKQNYYRLVNVISQIANLSAQKKIGSNFDISTAVYGTHLYRNVLPYKISDFLHNLSKQNNLDLIAQGIHQLTKIDPQIDKLDQSFLNNQFYSYIIDINKGADTRVMVKNFMAQLKKCEKQIQNQFYTKSKQITLQLYNSLKNNELSKVRQINQEHRKLQQKYSDLCSVAIQPKDLKLLINKFTQLQQVLYAICPGSGGYDAIFILARKDIYNQLNQICKAQNNKVRPVQIVWTQNNLNSADLHEFISEQELNRITQVLKKQNNKLK